MLRIDKSSVPTSFTSNVVKYSKIIIRLYRALEKRSLTSISFKKKALQKILVNRWKMYKYFCRKRSNLISFFTIYDINEDAQCQNNHKDVWIKYTKLNLRNVIQMKWEQIRNVFHCKDTEMEFKFYRQRTFEISKLILNIFKVTYFRFLINTVLDSYISLDFEQLWKLKKDFQLLIFSAA